MLYTNWSNCFSLYIYSILKVPLSDLMCAGSFSFEEKFQCVFNVASFVVPCHLGNPLQVLAVGIAVQVEVGLQHLQLLVGESGSHAFGFGFPVRWGRRIVGI